MAENSVGNVVKMYREAKGISRKQLANRAGLTYMAVYYIETAKRKPTQDTINALARGLEVPAALLFSSYFFFRSLIHFDNE